MQSKSWLPAGKDFSARIFARPRAGVRCVDNFCGLPRASVGVPGIIWGPNSGARPIGSDGVNSVTLMMANAQRPDRVQIGPGHAGADVQPSEIPFEARTSKAKRTKKAGAITGAVIGALSRTHYGFQEDHGIAIFATRATSRCIELLQRKRNRYGSTIE